MCEIVAAAFEVFYFERFVDNQENVGEIIDIIKPQIRDIETDCCLFFKEADKILGRCGEFCQETQNEGHRKTGTFWMKYINLIHIYGTYTGKIIYKIDSKFVCVYNRVI